MPDNARVLWESGETDDGFFRVVPHEDDSELWTLQYRAYETQEWAWHDHYFVDRTAEKVVGFLLHDLSVAQQLADEQRIVEEKLRQRIAELEAGQLSDDKDMRPLTVIQLRAEVRRARTKFPGNDRLLWALMEEVGELAKAMLEKEPAIRVREEALQAACVAVRIAEEGDADATE